MFYYIYYFYFVIFILFLFGSALKAPSGNVYHILFYLTLFCSVLFCSILFLFFTEYLFSRAILSWQECDLILNIQNQVYGRNVIIIFLLQALSSACEDNMLDYNPTTLYRSKSADALTPRRRSMAILS